MAFHAKTRPKETAFGGSRINSDSIRNADKTYDFFVSDGSFKIKMYINDLNNYYSKIGSTFPKVQ